MGLDWIGFNSIQFEFRSTESVSVMPDVMVTLHNITYSCVFGLGLELVLFLPGKGEVLDILSYMYMHA